jgi:Peptidase family M28
MPQDSAVGWKQLIPSPSCYRGPSRYPIDAYSEFMPYPRLGWKPYGDEPPDPEILNPDDPHGWYVPEYEEANELQPGLEQVARQVLAKLHALTCGGPHPGLSRRLLDDNVYWPQELQERAGNLAHERCVVLLSLALSRTQDDKGRVRWTLFGASEQGPARAFWKSFSTAPGTPGPADEGPRFVCNLLRTVYREPVETADDLHRAGFRILPQGRPPLDFWGEPLPGWARPFLLPEDQPPDGVKYLLTFRPFGQLPDPVRRAYLKGELHLLPSPAGLAFWGVPRFLRLHRQLPLGLQAPLLLAMTRHSAHHGLRVPQAGLLHEPGPHGAHPPAHPELVRNTYKRTHRWDRVLRDQDELALLQREDKLLHVLFSTIPDDLGLYDKPLARNVQLWTPDGELLLDGPSATPDQLKHALRTVEAGGTFGYRFQFPAMRLGSHEVYWHRPLAAYHSPDTDQPAVLADAPLGYLTAYATGTEPQAADARLAFRTAFRVPQSSLDRPVELWPRLHRRPLLLASMPLCHQPGRGPTTARNVRKLFDAFHLRGGRLLPRRLARQLVTIPREETLDQWLESLRGDGLADAVGALIEPALEPLPRRKGARVPESLTFARTGRRSFEVAYWKAIATLAEGRFLNKNNADCVRDAVTQRLLPYHGRHLDALGDYLLDYYLKRLAAADRTGQALAGELPFRWSTDFDFCWMGGWLMNEERPAERNLLVMIPGRDRGRAVIMADHYDTAYMADRYEKDPGGRGARLAASGADDNHSATAALMLAAPIFLELSKQGRLDCDVWLVHLTGEEFPADCLGARHLTELLVEGRLALHLPGGDKRDLSGVRVQGLYVSDMIAHNNDRERDVFQISPGTGPASWWLAEQANLANTVWNESVPVWNQRADRKGRLRARRSPYGAAVPEVAPHLALSGQVRPVTDPHSTLYNTDGQIFSDAGVPVVLFMEDYDINRCGYHDTHDTMANIDLDYGAALAAIVIESVARAAAGAPGAAD